MAPPVARPGRPRAVPPSLAVPRGGRVSRRALLRGGGTLLGAFGAAPLLSSCGSGGGSGGNELSFWNFYSPSPEGGAQSKWFEDLVAAWNKDHEVKVKLRYVPPPDYLSGSALQTAFSSGEGPDVFLLSPGDFLRYYNGGVLSDLTPVLADGAADDFVEGVLDTRTVDGKVYGLPLEIEPLAMFYSVAAFEEAGLSEADLPTTWDALLDVADRLTTSNRFGVLFETTPGYYQNFTWYPFMWMGDASAVAEDQSASAFDAPGTVAALDFWRQTIAAGVAPRDVQGNGANDTPANLGSGTCAIQQTGIWGVAELQQQSPDLEFGVFKLPTPPDGTYTTDMGGWAMCANAKGANPEAAAEFVAWAVGSMEPDGVERVRQWTTVAKTVVPTRTSVMEAARAEGTFTEGPLKYFLDEVVPGGQAEPRYPPEVYRAVSDAIQACQLDGADPGKTAADAAAKIDTFLQSYDGAPIL